MHTSPLSPFPSSKLLQTPPLQFPASSLAVFSFQISDTLLYRSSDLFWRGWISGDSPVLKFHLSTMSEHPPAKDDLRRLARPEEVPSVIKEDMLPVLRKKYHLPADLVMRLPSKSERIVLPPSGFIGVYEMSLQAGVRFPLPPELMEILQICGICLSQLSCRAVTIVMGLILFFRERKSSLTPEVLSRLCRFVSDSQGRISCRSKSLELRTRDPFRNWSGRFFFVKNEWKLQEGWGELKDLPSSLQVGDEDVLRLLGFRSLSKRKIIVQPTTGRSSSTADPPPDSPKSRVPDQVLKLRVLQSLLILM